MVRVVLGVRSLLSRWPGDSRYGGRIRDGGRRGGVYRVRVAACCVVAADRWCGVSRAVARYKPLKELTLDQLLTMPELSAYLGTPVKTLRRWRLTGYGPRSAKIGRRILYRRSDVDRFIDEAFADNCA